MSCSRIHIKLLSFCCKVVFFVLHPANQDIKDVSNREAHPSLLLQVSAGFYQKTVAKFSLLSNVKKEKKKENQVKPFIEADALLTSQGAVLLISWL